MTDKTLDRIADALEKLVDAYAQAQRRGHYALTDRPETEWNFNEVRWLTDRYAANEARQREEAAPDPLDEDDHRDRIDRVGVRFTRRESGTWCTSEFPCGSGFTLAELQDACGPLTFAPDASPAPQDAAQDAAEGADDAVEGDGPAVPSEALAQQDLGPHIEQIAADASAFAKAFGDAAAAGTSAAISCPGCGHDIEQHIGIGCIAGVGADVCPCLMSSSDIARHLIAQATS